MTSVLVILAAVVAGWMLQLYATYHQSVRFNASVVGLKASGPVVTVGVGGNRYRGGRVYVAFSLDVATRDGVVADALVLAGWTTFAAARPLPLLVGRTVAEIAGEGDIEGLTRPQRLAARQAAELLLARPAPRTPVAPAVTPAATAAP